MPAYGTVITGYRGLSLEAAEREWTEVRTPRVNWEDHGAVGILYRVEAVSYSVVIDADREEYGSTDAQLELFGYLVKNWTEYGATLLYNWSGARRRWVNLRPGNNWASRSAAEAVHQFRLRRERQVFVLERQIRRAQREWDLTQPFYPEI